MNVPSETADASRRWLRWAGEDLSMAEAIVGLPDLVPRGACMWAHQTGEKALKALLVAHDIDPPKQHDLVKLARRLTDDSQHILIGVDLDELSRWAIDGRYPDDFEEATRAQALEAVMSARRLLATVPQRLDELLDGAD
jgi:HEPN domain-containing protein